MLSSTEDFPELCSQSKKRNLAHIRRSDNTFIQGIKKMQKKKEEHLTTDDGNGRKSFPKGRESVVAVAVITERRTCSLDPVN